jgi:hypothetical protein
MKMAAVVATVRATLKRRTICTTTTSALGARLHAAVSGRPRTAALVTTDRYLMTLVAANASLLRPLTTVATIHRLTPLQLALG